jgi:ParB-like chromosome segregation protein Spo0J
MNVAFFDAKVNKLKPHPFHKNIPALSPGDFENLRNDIKKDGILIPIIVDGDHLDVLLDGVNRIKIAKELGWHNVRAQTVEFDTPQEYEAFILRMALNRRQLDKADRLKLADQLSKMGFCPPPSEKLLEEADEPAPKKKRRKGRARKEAAKTMNVSERELALFSYLKAHHADLADKVSSKELSVSEAYRLAKEKESGGKVPAKLSDVPVTPVDVMVLTSTPLPEDFEKRMKDDMALWVCTDPTDVPDVVAFANNIKAETVCAFVCKPVKVITVKGLRFQHELIFLLRRGDIRPVFEDTGTLIPGPHLKDGYHSSNFYRLVRDVTPGVAIESRGKEWVGVPVFKKGRPKKKGKAE